MLAQTTFIKFIAIKFCFALVLAVAVAAQNQSAKVGAPYHLQLENARAAMSFVFTQDPVTGALKATSRTCKSVRLSKTNSR